MSISLDQFFKVLYSFPFTVWPVEGYWNISRLSCRTLAFTSYAFSKRGLVLVSLPHFLHKFWRKIFILLYSMNWPNFIAWLPLLCEILGNMCIAIVCKPGSDVMNFEVNLIFLKKPLFLHDQKVMTKMQIPREIKELLKRNKKHI